VIDRLAADQMLGSLDERLAGLPEPQRDALELRVVDGLDYEEIGQRLAISAEGARTRVFRALATLRAQIERSA
jgi:RNA polymerase sigma-70 factor (ECF subfamily)